MFRLDLRRDDDVRRIRTFLTEISGQIGFDERRDSRLGGETWSFAWTERRLLAKGAGRVFIPVEVVCESTVDGTLSFTLANVVSRHPTLALTASERVPGVAWGATAFEVRRLLDEATLRLLDRRRVPDPALPPAPPADGGVTPESTGGGP